jgi:hypothetical protein
MLRRADELTLSGQYGFHLVQISAFRKSTPAIAFTILATRKVLFSYG